MWEIIKGILIALIALPLIISGIQIILQVVFGGAVGATSLLASIWKKDEPLTFRDGLTAGIFYVFFLFILNLILFVFVYFLSSFATLLIYVNIILTIFAWIIALIALFRTKFKFAIAFIISETVLHYILGTIVDMLF